VPFISNAAFRKRFAVSISPSFKAVLILVELTLISSISFAGISITS